MNKKEIITKNIIMKKVISIFLIVILLTIIILINLCRQYTLAESKRYIYDGSNIDSGKYSGFKEKLDDLKSKHPNWNFVIMETGLDFEQVVTAQYTGHFGTPKNLIQGKSGGWICSICGDRVYDTGNWKCASEQAIRYYLDSRNWLVDSPYLFQFLQTDYLNTSDERIYSALNGTFLYSMENARTIHQVCKEKNANAYFIIARLLQEQGNSGGMTSKMVDTDGTIYYNLFNIGASGNTKDEVYRNALAKAKKEGWTSVRKCLADGIDFLFSSYIKNKQNSIYLNKFDVESYGGLYIRQYMQNIEAPKTEGASMYNKMKSAGLLTENLTFVIPVYTNMPTLSSSLPESGVEIYPKNIRVKEGHSNVMIRAGRSTNTSIVGKIENSSVVVLSVERYKDGWHKVILTDGTKGYVKFNTEYLEEIADITNCHEEVSVTKNDILLRVGPGFDESEVSKLEKGQTIHRIDNTGRYNFDGNIWDRVILGDSRQGFVIRDNIKKVDYSETFIVNAEGGLYLRESPAGEIIRKLDKGSIVTRLEIGHKVGEYTWDKVITEDGAIGYVAREFLIKHDGGIVPDVNNSISKNETSENDIETDESQNDIGNVEGENTIPGNNLPQNEIETPENNIENEQENNNTQNENSTQNEIIDNDNAESENNIEDDETEIETRIIIVEPKATAESMEGMVILRGTEEIKGTKMVATGDIAKTANEIYTIVKKGDTNGDGYVKANDYLIIKDYIMETGNVILKGIYKEAADVTGDNKVKANDYLKIKDYIMYDIDI